MTRAGDSRIHRHATDVLERLRAQGVETRELAADSRAIHPGDVFVAYPGRAADGRGHIDAAIKAGAAAVLWEREGFDWGGRWLVPNVAVDDLRRLAGEIASVVYGEPSTRLWIAGVTGTNGKTSTSQWIAQALAASGRRPLIIGTLGIGMTGSVLEANPNTTPDAILLQKRLAAALAQGADSAVMEVSSIGLDQGRVAGVDFDVAVFTNLTRDHLDYHGDMDRYAEAKLQLFRTPDLAAAIVNLDDPIAERMLAAATGPARQGHRIGYTLEPDAARHLPAARHIDALIAADHVVHREEGLAFRVTMGARLATVQTRLFGRFNVSNLLAVIATLVTSGIEFERAAILAGQLDAVPGRMQRVGGNGRPTVVVDYAHTPDALEQLLIAARDIARATGGRLIAVFGCGGDRDRGKRPQMGRIAAEHADRVIITSDNPRSEQPEAIIDEIVAGIPRSERSALQTIVDRAAAIESSIRTAARQDVIVLAGKGHEPYQEIAGERHPFSDRDEALRVLGEVVAC